MSEMTLKDWTAAAAGLSFRNQIFIDGQFVPSASGKTFASINPATGAVLADVAEGDEEDIRRAVASGRKAFENGVWSRMGPMDRKAVLLRLAELIRQNLTELALLDSLDMGKLVADAATVDVPGSALFFQWYAEAIDKIYDEVAPTGPGDLALITREPLGVVGAVVPWNFPLDMATWKAAAALAAGNSVVLKPAEQSPLSALRLAELAAEAGIPEGVFNVVPGFGPTAGKALGLHNDVDCLAFTGSTAIGKMFQQYAGQSNMKQVWLETGGKSPNLVFADCQNLEAAADMAAFGIFFNQGEVCCAGSRLFVEESVHDEFVERLASHAAAINVGDPLDRSCQMGAQISDEQFQKILGYIDAGREAGARVVTGGERAADTGYFVKPTVFEGVTNDMKIAREEIFGPVVSTIAFSDIDSVLEAGNDTNYGLSAGIWTRDIAKAHRAARALRAGTVWINCFNTFDAASPFGGFKESGYGRELGQHALELYTQIKSVWVQL